MNLYKLIDYIIFNCYLKWSFSFLISDVNIKYNKYFSFHFLSLIILNMFFSLSRYNLCFLICQCSVTQLNSVWWLFFLLMWWQKGGLHHWHNIFSIIQYWINCAVETIFEVIYSLFICVHAICYTTE